MKCAQVLNVIDAGSLADVPDVMISATRAHMRDCAACRTALETVTALPARLAQITTPVAVPDFGAVVLARVASLSAVSQPAEADTIAARVANGFPLGLTVLSGLAAAAAVMMARPPHVEWDSLTTNPLAAEATSPIAAVALVATLAMYAASLSAPLSGGPRRPPSR
jgi:predicted anti-sigma-YlaC factor YlaD